MSGYVNDEAARLSGEKVAFSFGENWQKFNAENSHGKLDKSRQSFVEFTGMNDLSDHTFLDVGCGSGLSSLVAIGLNAKKVVSIDVDPHSVDCCTKLRDRLDLSAERWQVHKMSVLDQDSLKSLGEFSYVYSWGVLHHTGAMWEAMRNVLRYSVAQGSYLHIALYNAAPRAKTWLRIKRMCNRSPRVMFPLIKYAYISALLGKRLVVNRESPAWFVKDYAEIRGMNFFRDVDDWLGGLPYEFCTVEQVNEWMDKRGVLPVRLKPTNSCGCNEFLLQSVRKVLV